MIPMLTILGPTASGKTQVAVAVAKSCPELSAEIISADSRQVYRRMDIGTGKDLREYDGVPYHLIDICEPGTKYNLFEYQRDFARAYDDIRQRGAVPILCGGTGLYIEAVLKGYQLSPVPQNPELRSKLEGRSLEELTEMLRELKARNGSTMHNTTDVDSAQRAIRAIEIELGSSEQASPAASEDSVSDGSAVEKSVVVGSAVGKSVVVGIAIDRELRREKITRRLNARLDEGMADEVRSLLDSGIPADDLMYYGLEYRYVTEYVLGLTSREEMFRRLEIAIHQFAKRQMTWFRGMERRGTVIHWIDATLPMDEKVETIKRLWL